MAIKPGLIVYCVNFHAVYKTHHNLKGTGIDLGDGNKGTLFGWTFFGWSVDWFWSSYREQKRNNPSMYMYSTTSSPNINTSDGGFVRPSTPAHKRPRHSSASKSRGRQRRVQSVHIDWSLGILDIVMFYWSAKKSRTFTQFTIECVNNHFFCLWLTPI